MADRQDINNRDDLWATLEEIVSIANKMLDIMDDNIDEYNEYADVNPNIKAEIKTHRLNEELEEYAEQFKEELEKL